ncbi:MAG: hypothetical protein JNM33_13720 [Rubrivivax sp.]|nr:hypothetical protein [Rubrivivax sp.]
MIEPSHLHTFLQAEANSRAREFMLTSRVAHDLTIAAATRGYALLVYYPTVDSDGFDLIVDDRDKVCMLQLKSFLAGGMATRWAIHRKLLRPSLLEIEWFGFEPSAVGEGRGGGVLLIEADVKDSTVDLKYRYTDLSILTAFWMGLIPLHGNSVKAIDALRNQLAAEPGGKIDIPKTAFLEARSPEHLLALMGLHSRYSHSVWPGLLIQLARHEYEGEPLVASKDTTRELISEELKKLAVLP